MILCDIKIHNPKKCLCIYFFLYATAIFTIATTIIAITAIITTIITITTYPYYFFLL